VLDRKPVNLEAEKQKALQERQQLIDDFEANFIYDQNG